jgi:glucosamine--fructose-6-phosphate aminotransferase (isomerizing)
MQGCTCGSVDHQPREAGNTDKLAAAKEGEILMCGIVAASAHRDVSKILISGLHALEYRGYDSAGIAIQQDGVINRQRTQGKVRDLEALLLETPLSGHCGIAHTRWATHGIPNTQNAHPHVSSNEIALGYITA